MPSDEADRTVTAPQHTATPDAARPDPPADRALAAALAPWGREQARVTRLTGGWNSATWLVHDDAAPAAGPTAVAKLADTADAAAFRAGLRVAARAEAHGLRAGAPLRTATGRLSVTLSAGELALLDHVPDTPPGGGPRAAARRDGATLARAHLALAAATGLLDPRHVWPWPWASAALADLPMPPRLRAAGNRVLDAARQTVASGALRVGVLHGDPDPDAFRHHPEDPARDGLIDWAAVMAGPVLYDLACYAVLTRDTPELLEACLAGYRTGRPVLDAELSHLDTLVRLRWMCVGIWFAARAARGIRRSPVDGADNERGMAEAYHGMTAPAPL